MCTYNKFNNEVIQIGASYVLVSNAVRRLRRAFKVSTDRVWKRAGRRAKKLKVTILDGLADLYRERGR
jgi:hypothetical protein